MLRVARDVREPDPARASAAGLPRPPTSAVFAHRGTIRSHSYPTCCPRAVAADRTRLRGGWTGLDDRSGVQARRSDATSPCGGPIPLDADALPLRDGDSAQQLLLALAASIDRRLAEQAPARPATAGSQGVERVDVRVQFARWYNKHRREALGDLAVGSESDVLGEVEHDVWRVRQRGSTRKSSHASFATPSTTMRASRPVKHALRTGAPWRSITARRASVATSAGRDFDFCISLSFQSGCPTWAVPTVRNPELRQSRGRSCSCAAARAEPLLEHLRRAEPADDRVVPAIAGTIGPEASQTRTDVFPYAGPARRVPGMERSTDERRADGRAAGA